MFELGSCSEPGHSWTGPFNLDSFDGDGDFELLSDLPRSAACLNPTGMRAYTPYGGTYDWPVHLSLEFGFWCLNNEQLDGVCFDYQVEYCCPKSQVGDCPAGYSWSAWQDEDDPTGWGDWEFPISRLSCRNPVAVKAETVSGNDFK